MIFPALYRFAKNHNLLDDLDFVEQTIHCVLRLDLNGHLLSIANVEDDANPIVAPVSRIAGRNSKAIASIGADQIVRVIPRFDLEAKKFVVQSQVLFRNQMDSVFKANNDAAIGAIVEFLDRIHADPTEGDAVVVKIKDTKVRPTGWLTFQVAGCHNEQLCPKWDSLKSWWREQSQKVKPVGNKGEVVCSVTGKLCVPVRTHGTRIKVAPGGRKGGVALVSCDKSAFGSYGFKKALISPMSREAVEGYIRAIEWLGKKQNADYHYHTGFNKGDTIFLFWSDQPIEAFNPAKAIELGSWPELLSEVPVAINSGVPISARKVFISPFSGQLDSAHAASAGRFYCLSLSGSAARGVIRGWIDEPLPTARRNAEAWLEDITIPLDRVLKVNGATIAEPGQVWGRWPLDELVACLQGKGEGGKEDIAQQRQQLWEAALLGTPPPLSLLILACRRIPNDHYEDKKKKKRWNRVTPVRAALIRCILKRLTNRKEFMKPNPDLTQLSAAFQCGRLLRLLQYIQFKALGNVNATVVDKFYSAASATPNMVFGSLVSKTNAHLSKLKTAKHGVYVWADKQLTEICTLITKLGGFPNTNQPPQQGEFALGFYYQSVKAQEEAPEKEEENNLETPETETEN